MANNLITNIRKLKQKSFFNRSRNTKEETIYNGIFYKVEKEGGKYFYVGGSVHVGSKRNIRFNDVVEKAYKDSTKVAVEIDITDLKNILNLRKCYTNSTRDETHSEDEDLELNTIQPEDNKKFESLCKDIGLSRRKYAKLSTGMFSNILLQKIIKRAGYKSIYGIDIYFINRAKRNKKEVISLETPSAQVNALNAASKISPGVLGNEITSIKDFEAEIDSLSKLHDATFEGDTLTLVNETFRYKPINDSDRDNLNTFLYDRNKIMANKVEALVESAEIYFVIVGAAHVIGKGGLLTSFKEKGFKISRLL